MSSEQQNPFDPIVPQGQPYPPPQSGDPTGGLVPYKNVPALVAYYLGVFSLIPCLGSILCVPAIVLGIMGLAKAKKNPEAKGGVHAWVGIVLGGFALLLTMVILGAAVIGVMREANRF